MLNNASDFRKVYIAAGYTDLRHGIDGLASIVKFNFQLDSYEKDILFLFCGRCSDRIKGLVWEGDGFLSLDICAALGNIAADEIYWKEWWNQYSMLHIYDPDIKIEILNIQEGKSEGRYLEQNLQDIQKGIHVVHASDLATAKKQKKKEEKKKREQTKIIKLEEKAAQYGLQVLDPREQEFLRKRLGTEELNRVCTREAESGGQMDLTDYFEM